MMIAAAIDLVVAMSFGCVQIAAFEKSGELRRPTGSRLSPRSRYFAPLALGTEVCRYNWHSAGSPGWSFSMLKYECVFK